MNPPSDANPIAALSEHEWAALQLAIKTAVAEGVKAGLADYDSETCTRRCDRVTEAEEDLAGHHTTLYGEDGRGGLTRCVADLESRVKLLLWLAATSGAAAIACTVALVATLVTGA